MNFYNYYGEGFDVEALRPRLAKILNAFRNTEGADADFLFSSPGRAEILGNHTDHNHGKVMVAAVSCDILTFASPTTDGSITLYSEGYPPIKTTTNDSEIKKEEYGTSLALVKGVCTKLHELGYEFGGFVAHTTSDIFKGAG